MILYNIHLDKGRSRINGPWPHHLLSYGFVPNQDRTHHSREQAFIVCTGTDTERLSTIVDGMSSMPVPMGIYHSPVVPRIVHYRCVSFDIRSMQARAVFSMNRINRSYHIIIFY